MIVFFIEESNKNKILKQIETYEDRIIINKNVEKLNKNMMNKINKILDNNSCTEVILSKKLKSNKILKNSLYSNDINIVNGKNLYKKMLEKIIESICIKNKLNSEECQISIMVNYKDRNVVKIIGNLSKKFKMLSIVSNNMDLFKHIKEDVYNDDGIIITVTNNKRKALLKPDVIINYDFPEEVINKYAICDNAIIINTEEPINIYKKRFTGKIINDFEISFVPHSNIALELEKEKYNKFELKDLADVYVMKYPEEVGNIII